MRYLLHLTLLFLLIPFAASAYELHDPIYVEGIRASPEDPYIIEGYEISSDEKNCIEVRDSTNVIIRNNYLHHCNWSDDDPYSMDKGYALLVSKSKDIIIEENKVHDSKIGIVAIRTEDIRILNNDIRDTNVVGSLRCESCRGLEVAHNYLIDNGKPEWFWVPGQRVLGIHIVGSDDVDIHHNTVIRSSSDGIAVSGQIDGSMEDSRVDWKVVSSDIRIYNNLLLDNLELGIWLARIRGMKIFNNTIRDHYGGIVLDFDISDAEVYDNKILVWIGHPISVHVSHNNHIHDNKAYMAGSDKFEVQIQDDPQRDAIKSEWSGIPYSPSSGNIVENNVAHRITGELRGVILSKQKRVFDEEILKEKGWFSCEIEEGLIDKECAAREEAKGFQGMPKEVFVFEPLMEDFDGFTVKDSEGLGYVFEQVIESWKVALSIIVLIALLSIIIISKIKKNRI